MITALTAERICGKGQAMKIEDAIKLYEFWAEDDRIDVRIRKEHRQIADWLKELNADRPQGEWIMSKPEEDGFGAVFQCSRCSCEVDCVPTNFCPNCGARMKGAKDERIHSEITQIYQ